MSMEGNLAGTVQLAVSLSHLDDDAKTQVVLAAYWEILKACGVNASRYKQQLQQQEGDEQTLRQPLDDAHLSAVDVTVFNKPCTVSLEDGVVTVQLCEQEQMRVRAVDLKIASRVPSNPCGLVLVAQSTTVASIGVAAAAEATKIAEDVAFAVVLTIPSPRSLSDILSYIMDLNSSVKTTIVCVSQGLPTEPPRASQEGNSNETDEPPMLQRKTSIRHHGPRETPLDHGSHLPAESSESSGHYPLRGQLSVNKRAQDCTSGIYDTVPLGPPKKVLDEGIDEENVAGTNS